MQKKEKIRKILTIIFTLMEITLLVIIFGFSNQSGKESDKVSMKITQKVTKRVKSIQQLDESKRKIKLEQINGIIRKIAHYLLYTLLGISTMGLILSAMSINIKRKIVYSLSIGILYAVTDEMHQLFVQERGGRITDVLIDSIGIITGVCICLIMYKIYLTKQEKLFFDKI